MNYLKCDLNQQAKWIDTPEEIQIQMESEKTTTTKKLNWQIEKQKVFTALFHGQGYSLVFCSQVSVCTIPLECLRPQPLSTVCISLLLAFISPDTYTPYLHPFFHSVMSKCRKYPTALHFQLCCNILNLPLQFVEPYCYHGTAKYGCTN